MTGTTEAPATATEAAALADALTDLGALALAFGRIDRTACFHPDGVTRESDSDHTVMLGWVAPALAARCRTGLDAGLVAQFALVHDAVEVFAGDTPTLRITDQGRADKAAREHAAAQRWREMFAASLPWLPEMIGRYERQAEPEARFVRAADKCLPKIVHLLDGCAGLREHGVSAAELTDTFTRQEADMRAYAGELRAELVARTVALHAQTERRTP